MTRNKEDRWPPAEEMGSWLSEEAGAGAGTRWLQVAFPPAFRGPAENWLPIRGKQIWKGGVEACHCQDLVP